MLLTKEHYELLARFEAEYKHRRVTRETNKELWYHGNIYEDGHVNELFLAYRKGYALGTVSGDAANSLAAAPVAIVDTRDARGLCAPTEDDFPALRAMQAAERSRWRELVEQLIACHEDRTCPAIDLARDMLARDMLAREEWPNVLS